MTTAEAAEVETNAQMSAEEVNKIKEDIGVEDSFKGDATVEDEVTDDKGNFPVTKEELSLLRAELASEFPDDYQYLRYVLSIEV